MAHFNHYTALQLDGIGLVHVIKVTNSLLTDPAEAELYASRVEKEDLFGPVILFDGATLFTKHENIRKQISVELLQNHHYKPFSSGEVP